MKCRRNIQGCRVQERGIPWTLASTRANPQEAAATPRPQAGQAAGLGSVSPLGLSWPEQGLPSPHGHSPEARPGGPPREAARAGAAGGPRGTLRQ